jgi:hypothetical protein
VTKDDLLNEAYWAAKALRTGAIKQGEFVICVRNALVRYLTLAWREAGGQREDVDLLRIQHDALATLNALCEDVRAASTEAGAVDCVERLGWWHDNATLTGVRVAALQGLTINEDMFYYGPDFRITKADVDKAIREAEERVGPEWSGLMVAGEWVEEEEA